MRDEHIKGWLAEARKKEREEAAAEQKEAVEGKKEATKGTGGGGEEIRGKTPEEVSNWERVVYLTQTAFGEEHLVE